MNGNQGEDISPLISNSQRYLSSIISLLSGIIISSFTESIISDLLSSRTFLFHSGIGILMGLIVGILVGFTIVKIAIEFETSVRSSIVQEIPIIGQHVFTLLLLLAIPGLILVVVSGGVVGGSTPDPAPPNGNGFYYIAPISPSIFILPVVAFFTTLLILRSYSK